MPRPCYRLAVRGAFSASHCLRHFKGKCENLHGHNFSVEMTVTGESLDPKVEILADFGDLKRVLKEALSTLDHQHLNDVFPFTEQNPSSENIARYIYRKLQDKAAALGCKLESVTVCEKEGQSATYWEE